MCNGLQDLYITGVGVWVVKMGKLVSRAGIEPISVARANHYIAKAL